MRIVDDDFGTPDLPVTTLCLVGFVEADNSYLEHAIDVALELESRGVQSSALRRVRWTVAVATAFDFGFDLMSGGERSTLRAFMNAHNLDTGVPAELMLGASGLNQMANMARAIVLDGYHASASTHFSSSLAFWFGDGTAAESGGTEPGRLEVQRYYGVDGGNHQGGHYSYRNHWWEMGWLLHWMKTGTDYDPVLQDSGVASIRKGWLWNLWNMRGEADPHVDGHQDTVRITSPLYPENHGWGDSYIAGAGGPGAKYANWRYETCVAAHGRTAKYEAIDIFLNPRLAADAALHPKDSASPEIASYFDFDPPGTFFWRQGLADASDDWDIDRSVKVRVNAWERYNLQHRHLDSGSMAIWVGRDQVQLSPSGRYFTPLQNDHIYNWYQRSAGQSGVPLVIAGLSFDYFSTSADEDGGQPYKKYDSGANRSASRPYTIDYMTDDESGDAWLLRDARSTDDDSTHSKWIGHYNEITSAYLRRHDDTPELSKVEVADLFIKRTEENGLAGPIILRYIRLTKSTGTDRFIVPFHHFSCATDTPGWNAEGFYGEGKCYYELFNKADYTITRTTAGAANSDGWGADQFKLYGEGTNHPPEPGTGRRSTEGDLYKEESIYVEIDSPAATEEFVVVIRPQKVGDAAPTALTTIDDATFYGVTVDGEDFKINKTTFAFTGPTDVPTDPTGGPVSEILEVDAEDAAFEEGIISAVNNSLVEETGTAGWIESACTIDAGDLTAGRDYLVMASGLFGRGSATSEIGMRVKHGSTAFSSSVEQHESGNSATATVMESYEWFRVWEAVASEDLDLEIYNQDSGATVQARFQQLVALDLRQVTYEYNENTTQTASTASYQDGASITFTPATTGKYLVMGHVTMISGDFDRSEINLNQSGGATDDVAANNRCDELQSGQGRIHHPIKKVYTLTGSTEYTFKMQHRYLDSGPEHLSSAIIAIRLDSFDESDDDADDNVTATTNAWASTPVQMATVSVTPASTSNVLVIASHIYDAAGSSQGNKTRLQAGGSDIQTGRSTASGGTGYVEDVTMLSTVDDARAVCAVIESASGAQTIDYDQASSGSGSATLDNITLVAFTHRISGGAAENEWDLGGTATDAVQAVDDSGTDADYISSDVSGELQKYSFADPVTFPAGATDITVRLFARARSAISLTENLDMGTLGTGTQWSVGGTAANAIDAVVGEDDAKYMTVSQSGRTHRYYTVTPSLFGDGASISSVQIRVRAWTPGGPVSQSLRVRFLGGDWTYFDLTGSAAYYITAALPEPGGGEWGFDSFGDGNNQVLIRSETGQEVRVSRLQVVVTLSTGAQTVLPAQLILGANTEDVSIPVSNNLEDFLSAPIDRPGGGNWTVANLSDIEARLTTPSDDQYDVARLYAFVEGITAEGVPVADFVAQPLAVIVGETVQFTDLSTGAPDEWAWDFGDTVGTSTLQNPTYAYASAGTYTVTLDATNSSGTDQESKTAYIVVSAAPTPPDADFTADENIVPLLQPVQFNDTSTGTITSWLWEFGDGASSTEQNPMHAYDEVGEYTVTLTVNDGADSETKPNFVAVFDENEEPTDPPPPPTGQGGGGEGYSGRRWLLI